MAPRRGAPFQKAALLGERRLLGDFDRRRLPVLAVRTEAVLGRILRDTRCRNHHRRVTRFRTKDGIVLTLTGLMSITELEAAAKRLSELERLP